MPDIPLTQFLHHRKACESMLLVHQIEKNFEKLYTCDVYTNFKLLLGITFPSSNSMLSIHHIEKIFKYYIYVILFLWA